MFCGVGSYWILMNLWSPCKMTVRGMDWLLCMVFSCLWNALLLNLVIDYLFSSLNNSQGILLYFHSFWLMDPDSKKFGRGKISKLPFIIMESLFVYALFLYHDVCKILIHVPTFYLRSYCLKSIFPKIKLAWSKYGWD